MMQLISISDIQASSELLGLHRLISILLVGNPKDRDSHDAEEIKQIQYPMSFYLFFFIFIFRSKK